jgi:hypothetical protein
VENIGETFSCSKDRPFASCNDVGGFSLQRKPCTWPSTRVPSVSLDRIRHRPSSNLPFHPIVLSLGGMMNGSTTKVFASWKQVMTRGTYNLMLKRLSLCLLQRGSAALSY